MKSIASKIIDLYKGHKLAFIILILVFILFLTAIYSNRIGIRYYFNKFFGLNLQVDKSINEVENEDNTKPLSLSFVNWYVEVDLDDINNPYKNVNLDNVIISGGIGEYDIKYEIIKDGYSSKMVYTVTDEADNIISQSQKITYVSSRTSRDNAVEVFYKIAQKYNYSVTNMNEDYKSGVFSKYSTDGKYYRQIVLYNQRLGVSTVGNYGIYTNDYCDYDVIRDNYNCILNGTNIDYEKFTELQQPMSDLINEYNKILDEYIQAGYSYEYFIAQVKD